MTTREQAARLLLQEGQWPNSQANVLGLVTAASEENTEAAFNPWATTEPEPGAGDFNSAGVKNYDSLAEGITATLATLRNGLYPGIIGALEAGDDAEQLVTAWASSPWGTWSGPNATENATGMLGDVEGNFATYANHPIGGQSEPPPPPPETTCSVTLPILREESPMLSDPAVRIAQRAVGASPVDGVYGPESAAAVERFQSRHGLAADGVVGPDTWHAVILSFGDATSPPPASAMPQTSASSSFPQRGVPTPE